jgi:hypothetical protein
LTSAKKFSHSSLLRSSDSRPPRLTILGGAGNQAALSNIFLNPPIPQIWLGGTKVGRAYFNHAKTFDKLITNMTYKQLIEKLQAFSPEQLEQTVTVWNVWTDELISVVNIPKNKTKILLELNN